ncbi:anaphase promoting complex subunit 11 [Rhodotorula paludigena]|uniref:anaphase promoting complex subunit 11 n=1 Tax=Rhodotorula paludigena TaxID=86838 RepID=UPI0031768931
MKLTVNHYHGVALWRWNLKPADAGHPTRDNPEEPEHDDSDDEDDVCGICRVAFDGCCPDCKVPGDGCPPIFGECSHVFHMHCIMKWLATDSSKQQCPMDRRPFVVRATAGGPAAPPALPDHLAAVPAGQQDISPNVFAVPA